MRSKVHRLLLAVFAACWSSAQAAPNADLAAQGYAVLKRHCYRCHGLELRAGDLNVLDRKVLTRVATGKATYLVAGDLEASQLWRRAGLEKTMPPPEEKERPDAAELETLRRWIEAEAPFPDIPPRPFLNDINLLTAIRDHLLASDEEDRRFQRYFSLVNLHNLKETLDERDLKLHRAALSKLVNSLSWQENIVVPKTIDVHQTIVCIDLRTLGWDDGEQWHDIVRPYPYALKHDRDADPQLAALAAEVYRLSDCELPYVRADWFLASASRPPLYYKLLELPDTFDKLQELLKIDVLEDFRENRLHRAGVSQSGVSRQNRVIDRHVGVHGPMHVTYDFKPQKPAPAVQRRRNIFQFPLGPASEEHLFPDLAFEQDGGEMIFRLPNGLQGYFLTDAKGKRIDVGPIDVVVDPGHSSGTPEVVAGISCMSCHDQGMQRFDEKLSTGLGVFGEARRKVERLVAPVETMNLLLAEDQERFVAALQQACGPFLREAGGPSAQASRLPEPITLAAKQFQKDLRLAEVAAELGMNDAQQLKQLILSVPELRSRGLAPLVDGGALKRDAWQNSAQLLSEFQIVANTLDRGTPFHLSEGAPATEPAKAAARESTNRSAELRVERPESSEQKQPVRPANRGAGNTSGE